MIRYSCISIWKLYLDSKCNWPSRWQIRAEARFSVPSIDLLGCHEHILVSLLTYQSIFLHLFVIVTFRSFRTDAATLSRTSFRRWRYCYLYYFSREAHEANRPSLANLYCCAFGIYVLVKGKLGYCQYQLVEGKYALELLKINKFSPLGKLMGYCCIMCTLL